MKNDEKKDNVKLFGSFEIADPETRDLQIKKLKKKVVEELLADESVWEIIEKTGGILIKRTYLWADPLEYPTVAVKLAVLVPGDAK